MNNTEVGATASCVYVLFYRRAHFENGPAEFEKMQRQYDRDDYC